VLGEGAGNFGGAKESRVFVPNTTKRVRHRPRLPLLDANYTMSRMSMAPQRNLSLTEELEKLEQSITLTLQGKHSFEHPTIATDPSRNRPKLQPRPSHRNNRNPTDRRTIRKTLGSCLGRLQVLETVLRGQRQCLTFGLRSPRARRISCTRRD